MSSVIFNGNDVKTLKPNINIFGNVKILTGTTDPTSVATSANKGSLYLNNSTGFIYRKTDNGLSTNWTIAADSTLSHISSSTYSTIQDLMNFALSAGSSSGGTISDAGGATFDVAAGTGFIKAIDSNVATLSFFDWTTSSGNSIPSDTTRYVGVQYNAGSPNVVIKTSDIWDLDTEFPLGIVVNEAGTLFIYNIQWIIGDNQANLIERFDSLATVSRDNRAAGLILGNTGTRNVTVSAGSLLSRMSEFSISAIDTSAAGTFDAYYRNGSGGWTKQSAQTQWNNTQYDDGSGTLATLTVLDYSSRWFYLMLDGSLAMLYGQNQFTSLALGLGDSPPASVPPRIQAGGMLIGRFVIQTLSNTPSSTQTVFTTTFSSNFVQNHNDLANIQGGTSSNRYHLSNAFFDVTGPTTSVKTFTFPDTNATVATLVNGDISHTSFSATNNQAVATDVTGFAFANGTVRAFEALISVVVDATSDLFEQFSLYGIQRGADWRMSQTATGDNSGFVFTITSAGQIQYVNSNYAGFVSATVHFRAITTSI